MLVIARSRGATVVAGSSESEVWVTPRGAPAELTTLSRVVEGESGGMQLLLDFRDDPERWWSPDLRLLAAHLSTFRDRVSRVAILVDDRPLPFGVARLAQTHIELAGLESRIFRNAAEAYRWLGSDTETAIPA